MAQSSSTTLITDSTFESEVLQASGLILVDFWAEWCGPCRQLAPTLEQIANEYAGQIKVCKLNVDENSQTPAQYQIRGIPAVLFFKSGQLIDQTIGNQSKEAMSQTIKKHLNPTNS